MPKKKHAPPSEKQASLAGSTPPPLEEESGELKEYVDNYLALADKALGFVRRPGPNHQLTISTCVHCQHTIAASNLKLLGFAENLHVCPANRTHTPGHKP